MSAPSRSRGESPQFPPANRRAVVTGGGSGIGARTAERLAAAGMQVTVAGRRLDALQRVVAEITARGGSATAVRCDVADPSQVDALARSTGPVSVLVNNAGVARSAPLAKTDDRLWSETIAVNLTGTFLCTRAYLPAMMETGYGRVVNVASVAGKVGYRYTSAYCASKAGVLGFTRAVALEAAPRGVTVNAVCPGWVDTEMTDGSIANIVDKTTLTPEDARRTLERLSPQNRLMTADEVAALIAYLAGDAAGGITAQAINLDGGGLQS